MVVKQSAADLIEEVVREKFADGGIEAVEVVKSNDHEGGVVLNVTVVFNKTGTLDSHKTSGIVRQVRGKLLELEEAAFPIFTFISKSDSVHRARMKTAAA
jgi:hypothetical protein